MERPEENPPCTNCGFHGDFKYTWEDGDFLVTCPSCKHVNYKVEKNKIDSLVQDIVSSSMDQMSGATKEAKDPNKN